MTDTDGMVTKTFYDKLGRRLFVVENHQGTYDPTSGIGTVTSGENRTTGWLYNGLGQTTDLIAYNSGGTTKQITKYEYTDDYDAYLVEKTYYPDEVNQDGSLAMGAVGITTEYNLDGSVKKRTDQRGIVTEYSYDDAHRPRAERITSFGGSGLVDETIKSITRKYDSLGRLEKLTSHGNVTGDPDNTTSIQNQIKYTYGAVGKVTKTEQSNSGAVTTGTPAVEYAYDEAVTSNVYTNAVRPTTVTYPKSTTVAYFGYGSSGSIDDVLHRVKQLGFDPELGAEYSYNGIARLALVGNGVTGVTLELYQGTAGTYAGYDRFGRTVDQRWSGGMGDLVRIKYGYDYAGNRTWREDVVAAASSQNHEEFYTYDGLHRLKNFDRGDLAGTWPNYTGISGTPAKEEDWTLDQLGNWPGYVQKASGTTTLNQSRTHNAANELTEIDSSATHVGEDAAGNMIKIPKPMSWSAHFDLKYDAWNRLVEVKDGANVVASMKYDGLGRRVQRVVGNDTYDYYYNEEWQLLEERKNGASSPPLNQYLWHPYYIDALAIRLGSGGYYQYLHDANFNVAAVVEDNGVVLERYAYSAYGEVTFLSDDFTPISGNVSQVGNTHLYTGRERDPESGLQLNRERFYYAQIGRWLNRDPIEYEGSKWNLFEYASARPTSLYDPFGLRDCNQENIDCNRNCWEIPYRNLPWPWNSYPPRQQRWAQMRYCEDKCQEEYRKCEEEEKQRQPQPQPEPLPYFCPTSIYGNMPCCNANPPSHWNKRPAPPSGPPFDPRPTCTVVIIVVGGVVVVRFVCRFAFPPSNLVPLPLPGG